MFSRVKLCNRQAHTVCYREKYPEFLPRTDHTSRRDYVLEMLHRRDMFRRRQNLNIAEFYVGMYYLYWIICHDHFKNYIDLLKMKSSL